jgi:hypothetical protein
MKAERPVTPRMLLAGVQGFKTSGFPPEACGNDVRMVEPDICFLPDTLRCEGGDATDIAAFVERPFQRLVRASLILAAFLESMAERISAASFTFIVEMTLTTSFSSISPNNLAASLGFMLP